jgi:hypothetical protein
MSAEARIELHGSECSCRGGAWVLLEATQKSPCGGGNGNAHEGKERLVLGLTEWRQPAARSSRAGWRSRRAR